MNGQLKESMLPSQPVPTRMQIDATIADLSAKSADTIQPAARANDVVRQRDELLTALSPDAAEKIAREAFMFALSGGHITDLYHQPERMKLRATIVNITKERDCWYEQSEMLQHQNDKAFNELHTHITDLEATVKEQAAEIAALRHPDFREMREMLRAMQAGELTVSRGVEILEMWFAGNWNDDMLPPVRQDLIEEDSMPVEIIDRLRQQLAAAQLHIEQLRGALCNLEWWEHNYDNQYCPDCGNRKTFGKHTIHCSIGKALSTQPDLSALEAERQRVAEACAKVCENDESGRDSGGYFADAIRAGQ